MVHIIFRRNSMSKSETRKEEYLWCYSKFFRIFFSGKRAVPFDFTPKQLISSFKRKALLTITRSFHDIYFTLHIYHIQVIANFPSLVFSDLPVTSFLLNYANTTGLIFVDSIVVQEPAFNLTSTQKAMVLVKSDLKDLQTSSCLCSKLIGW